MPTSSWSGHIATCLFIGQTDDVGHHLNLVMIRPRRQWVRWRGWICLPFPGLVTSPLDCSLDDLTMLVITGRGNEVGYAYHFLIRSHRHLTVHWTSWQCWLLLDEVTRLEYLPLPDLATSPFDCSLGKPATLVTTLTSSWSDHADAGQGDEVGYGYLFLDWSHRHLTVHWTSWQ